MSLCERLQASSGFCIHHSHHRRGWWGALARELLPHPSLGPPISRLDFGRVPDAAAGFDTGGLRQEEIVNLGFKGLVLDAFAEAPGFELG